MKQDKELEKLFSAAITKFSDNENFLEQLSAKLDKLEYLKCVQQKQKRRYKMTLVLAFVSGAMGMLATLILLPLLPSDIDVIEKVVYLRRNIIFLDNIKVLSTLTIVALSYGLTFSINSFRKNIRE